MAPPLVSKPRASSEPRDPTRGSLATLWLIWGLFVFGALNVYSAPTQTFRDPSSDGYLQRGSAIANILNIVREDSDTRRYFALASAILGRRFDAFYFPGIAPTPPRPDPHFFIRADRQLWPWRDFPLEYPPGMILVTVLPALFTSEFPTYHLLFSLLMGALLTLSVALNVATADRLSLGAGRRTLIYSTVFILALGAISVRRYDPTVALGISVAIYGLVARKPVVAGLGLAAGVIAKLTPILLAPVGAIHGMRRGRWRELSIAGAVCALALALTLALYALAAGPRAPDMFAYHADRPLQVESPYAAALLIVGIFRPGLVHLAEGFGSQNVRSLLEPPLRALSVALTGLAIVSVVVWFWRASARAALEPERGRLTVTACTAILIVYIGLGKVFSPQYMVWLLPSGVIAASLASERSFLLLVAAAAMTQVEFPFAYYLQTPWTGEIVAVIALIRDGLLLGCAASLMVDASRPANPEPSEVR